VYFLIVIVRTIMGPTDEVGGQSVTLKVIKTLDCSFHFTSPTPYPGITLRKVSAEHSGDLQDFPRPPHSSQFVSNLPSHSSFPVERSVSHHPDTSQCKSQNKVRVNPSLTGWKQKLWKPNKVTKKLVLGSDIGLEETCLMSLCGLVG
jgi:hypothetical protein